MLGWPVAAQFVAAVLVSDLVNYWSHRALHEVPILWRVHAVHHSSEDLDWLSTSRGHPIDQILVAAAATLPLYAVGVDLSLAGGVLAVNFLFPFLVHANTRLTLRPLSAVVVTPAFHHRHHARERDAVNRNYGAIFSFWDRIFGSWHLPDRMPLAYGTDTPVARGWAGQMLHPFRRPEVAHAPEHTAWDLEMLTDALPPGHRLRLTVRPDSIVVRHGSTTGRIRRCATPGWPEVVVLGHGARAL
ncbi:MAG: sterol desaturase family protein, partial [Pseudonocardia sp.]|nr:sterol desaturase family protein [Pseudonocardia sp.]